MKTQIPTELELVRQKAARALGPLRPLTSTAEYDSKSLYQAKRTNAGRDLPPYYLVYFLLVNLLGFENAGQFEKVAWSIAVDWNGRGFLIDHRKFGVGVFAQDVERDEEAARQIVNRIQKAVRIAEPFFEWLASDAIARSAVNVKNNSEPLYKRYRYLLELSTEKKKEFEQEKSIQADTLDRSKEIDWTLRLISKNYHLLRESEWLVLSAVEAFFAWTEHVLIHVALLTKHSITAQQVADIAASDWSDKFRFALNISDHLTKITYDAMLQLRKNLRNYVAHGAFGKQGEAFTFHSGAGAVPVLLPHQFGSRKFNFGEGLRFDSDAAIIAMDEFVKFLWSGARAPARIYIQDSQLPLILTFVTNGTYTQAMTSSKSMEEFISYLSDQFDRSSNMDW